MDDSDLDGMIQEVIKAVDSKAEARENELNEKQAQGRRRQPPKRPEFRAGSGDRPMRQTPRRAGDSSTLPPMMGGLTDQVAAPAVRGEPPEREDHRPGARKPRTCSICYMQIPHIICDGKELRVRHMRASPRGRVH